MRAAWSAWKRAVSLIWEYMLPIIVLNLLWSSIAWLVLPLGPATLALYWYIAQLREAEPGLRFLDYYKAVLRLSGRGLVWGLGWVLVLLLGYTNLLYWGEMLPVFAAWLVRFAWIYGVIFLIAMQPYLLEGLVVREEGWLAALKVAAWQVAANPVYSHLHVLIPAAVLVVAYKSTTLMPLVLASLAVAFMVAIAAETPWKYGAPPPIERRIEDLL